MHPILPTVAERFSLSPLTVSDGLQIIVSGNCLLRIAVAGRPSYLFSSQMTMK